MKKGLIVLFVILGFVLLCFGYVVTERNSFVKMQEEVNARFAQVENQLKRRADLIPNLTNTVKGYAKHEKEIFEKLAEARSKMMGARSPQDLFNASNELNSALSRLLVVVENYPNLKADATFTRLMDELAGTENRISVERMRYNEAVKAFNQKIKLFPSNVIAGMFGFLPLPYYEVPQKDKETPVVDFK